MADKLSFELVSPERKLSTGEVDLVVIPGMEGEIGIMPDHAPFLTTLRPGIVTVKDGGEVSEFFVTGGFAEISASGAAVLAEEAVQRAELNREWFDGKIATAQSTLEAAGEETKQAAAQRLADFEIAAGLYA
ncbi:MAG: F0F1 ATP synthase subunit epsilon [Pseudomonadota bacterium]